jgi:cytochrome c oxidase subunit 4
MTTHAHGPVVETHDGNHGHDSLGHGHDGHEFHVAKYVYVFLALCFLTACSFFTYSCTKAMLVILFFMHVLYEANWKFVLTIPAAMMSIFLMVMLIPDVMWRMETASEERRHHMAEPKSPAEKAAHEKAADEQPVKHLTPEK